MPVGFTDSLKGNIELLQELIGGLPPSKREVAKRAAVMIENTVNKIKRDHGASDPAVGLGMAFAVCMIADQLLEADNEGDRKGLIQLLT